MSVSWKGNLIHSLGLCLTAFVSLIFAVNAGAAIGASEGSSTTSVSDLTQKSPYSLSVIGEHYTGFKEDADPSTAIYVSGSYKFKEKHRLNLYQPMVKLYRVNEGEDEFRFSDTLVRYYYTVGETFAGTKSTVRMFFTIPVSDTSSSNDNVTTTQAKYYLSKGFFKDKLTLGIAPYGTYYWNRFKTTPSSLGSGGGSPLKQYKLGATLSASYSVTPKISADVLFDWGRNYYETNDQKNNEDPNGTETNPPNHSYNIVGELGYQITKQWGAGIGVSHLSTAERYGQVEVVVVDVETTEWYLSTSYKF
jgi:hypothetical protein